MTYEVVLLLLFLFIIALKSKDIHLGTLCCLQQSGYPPTRHQTHSQCTETRNKQINKNVCSLLLVYAMKSQENYAKKSFKFL
jgi:hypothetical protein